MKTFRNFKKEIKTFFKNHSKYRPKMFLPLKFKESRFWDLHSCRFIWKDSRVNNKIDCELYWTGSAYCLSEVEGSREIFNFGKTVEDCCGYLYEKGLGDITDENL